MLDNMKKDLEQFKLNSEQFGLVNSLQNEWNLMSDGIYKDTFSQIEIQEMKKLVGEKIRQIIGSGSVFDQHGKIFSDLLAFYNQHKTATGQIKLETNHIQKASIQSNVEIQD